MVLDRAIERTTLNAFSASVRDTEKAYLADPSKGIAFKLDGRWQTFTVQDMRFEDLCTEFDLEGLRTAAHGDRPPAGNSAGSAAEIERATIFSSWKEGQAKIYGATRRLMTDDLQRRDRRMTGPGLIINEADGLGYTLWRQLRLDFGGGRESVKPQRFEELMTRPQMPDTVHPMQAASQLVSDARDVEPRLPEEHVKSLLLKQLPLCMQQTFVRDMKSRRSERTGHKTEPATVDEVLTLLGEEADIANRWPWSAPGIARPRQALAAYELPAYAPQQQLPPSMHLYGASPLPTAQPTGYNHMQPTVAWANQATADCWNCDQPGHRHFQCPQPLRPELQQRMQEQMQYGRGTGKGKGKGGQASRPPFGRGSGKGRGFRSAPAAVQRAAYAAAGRMDWQLSEEGVAFCGGHTWDDWLDHFSSMSLIQNWDQNEHSTEGVLPQAAGMAEVADQGSDWSAFDQPHWSSSAVIDDQPKDDSQSNGPLPLPQFKPFLGGVFNRPLPSFVAGIGLSWAACQVSFRDVLIFFTFLMCCATLLCIFPAKCVNDVVTNYVTLVPQNCIGTCALYNDPTPSTPLDTTSFLPQVADILDDISGGSIDIMCHKASQSQLDNVANGFEDHIMDSGASSGQHQHEQYVVKDNVTHKISVTVANGMHMFNKSSGGSAYKDKNGTILDTTNTTDYCMPNINNNLLSLMDMAKNGCTIVISNKLPNLIKVWNDQDQELDVVVKNNLPWCSLKPLTKEEYDAYIATKHGGYSSSSKVKGFTELMYHSILAHSDRQIIKPLSELVDGMMVKDDANVDLDVEGAVWWDEHGEQVPHDCIGCRLVKAKRKHFDRNPERATKVGRLHMDFKSTKVPSLYTGNTGYFLMWDEFSGVTCCIPTQTKKASAQLEAFKYFEAELVKHGHQVYEINCDGGMEYLAKECVDYWKLTKGYDMNVTGPDTPQHNARAERKIQTIDNKLNACLQQYQLHDCYWELALWYVVFVENRIISKHRMDMPPMQALTGKRVDLSRLTMPFGTLVYCLRLDRSKSEARKAHPGIFVGFPSDQPKCILVHIPALSRIAVVTHFVPDYKITTKAHRYWSTSRLD